jgi:fructokinase
LNVGKFCLRFAPPLNQPPLILALGEILWDLLPSGKHLGGAPANFAYHAAQLGARAITISAVGDDDLGREILELLRGLGLDASGIVVDANHFTGTVTVSLDAGQPSYMIHDNVAWDFIRGGEALADLAGAADCVCFGSLAQRSPISRETIQGLLARTKPDALCIFDINLRQEYFDRATLHQSLERADVLKINDVELLDLARVFGHKLSRETPSRFTREVLDAYGLDLIAVTRGAEGSVFHTPDGNVLEHPGYAPPRVADTVGAGDAFTAALAMGLLRSVPLEQVSDDANRLASYVCTQRGATPVIPPELLRSLAVTRETSSRDH